MKLPAIIARAGQWLARAVEGEPRPGPWYLPVTGGWLPASADMWNWWQCGYLPLPGPAQTAIVEACVSAYAQTIAMCPGDHWRRNKRGGRERVENSALARLLRYPNEYQTPSDFMLNLVRGLYLDGNAYALAERNDRFEIKALHLMNPRYSRPYVSGGDGEVFYTLGGNQVIWNRNIGQQPILVPRRDVLHVRFNCDMRQPWPLLGESPIVAAAKEVMADDAIMQQQTAFYMNQARPSSVLSTDLVLDKDQVQALRDRWNEQSRGMAAGNTPILTAGLKVQPWGIHAKDADLAEILKLTEQHIASVYRIPLQILGMGGGTPYSSTELLMQSWIATGLGFALNHIEEAFGALFQLRGQPYEYVAFDTGALLRSAMKDRLEALARGVQGGIYAPNEAREQEGLDRVEYGDEPRVQQQVVPLSAAGKIPAAPAPDAPPSAPAPNGDGATNDDNVRSEIKRLFASAARARRRYN